MIFKNFIQSGFFLVLVLFLASCSVSKHLDENARVQVKTNIKLHHPEMVKDKKKITFQLYNLALPKPAKGITKWQTKLYNKHSKKARRDSTGKAKGISGWIIRSIGKPPALFDSRKINYSKLRLEKYFQDNGYFGTTVDVDTTLKDKEVTVNYHVYPKPQYRIRNIHFPKDSFEIVRQLFTSKQKPKIISGAPYSQAALTAERERLKNLANDSGYLNISKDHFYFLIDTTLESHQVDIYFQLRQPKSDNEFKSFHLDQNVVYASYSLSKDPSGSDTTIIDNFSVIQKKNIIRPKVLTGIINGEKGDLYSLKKQDDALTRILDLGIYKFVNLKIDQKVRDSAYLFDRSFYLTPGLMQDVTAEFEANTRSTSYFGIAAAVTYSHKNIFRGAERFDFTVSGGIGTQNSASDRLLNTLDGAFELRLTLPKLLPPFINIKSKGPFVPKTQISIGDNYQERTEYYAVNTFTLQYGFKWAKTKSKHHQLIPLNINQFIVKNVTDAMRDLFEENPRLERSFSDVFILGLFYSYTLSTQTINNEKPYFYMRTGFETSGNLPDLIIQATSKQQNRPFTIFGAPYTQFVRLDGDFRYYIPMRNKSFVSRFIAGIGVPYGNSEVLPYIKQYFIGGPSSIRGFQFRSIGPGSTIPPEPENNNFIEQTGDMRLELNFEYRFPLVSYLKSAVFVDLGNIWLLNDIDGVYPDGIFDFDRFYKEIAVGTGLGLRLDLNVLVIRLDLAFPLRKPWLEEGNRWVLPEINIFNSNWRKENLVWNFAIGYPF